MALSSLAILQEFSGADIRGFRYLETASKDLYWAFVVPLAGLFEGVRKMFEKASEIRAAYRAKLLAKQMEKGLRKGRKEGIEQGREQGLDLMRDHLQEAYERFGVEQDGVLALPRTPEVEEFLFHSDRPYY